MQCIFHDEAEGLTAFALKEKEGSQLAWAVQHLFQNLPASSSKEWVKIKIILPADELYFPFQSYFETQLDSPLDVNEPIYCFQFSYIRQLDETLLDQGHSVFLLRRFKKQKCVIKFKQFE
jgi:hypothetical protein